jgi:creatinine amidohydrolase
MSHSSPKAQPKKGRYLEYLSWKEAETALQEVPIVILPLGARLKEHGLHLPLNNDWIMAEYLTRRVLDELAVLALPTVQYGYYPAFIEYPGSINIRKDTFREYISDICRSICHHGPKRVYILNTGISTNKGLEPARQQLAKEGIVMDYTLLTEATAEAEKKVRQESEGTHADEIETSMMLYMAPEIVRMKLAQKDSHPNRPGPLTRDEHATQGVYSPTGAWGDPTLATRDKGKVVTEALVAYLVRQIQQVSDPTYVVAPPRIQFL